MILPQKPGVEKLTSMFAPQDLAEVLVGRGMGRKYDGGNREEWFDA